MFMLIKKNSFHIIGKVWTGELVKCEEERGVSLCIESWRINTTIMEDAHGVHELNCRFESLLPLHGSSLLVSVSVSVSVC